MRRGSSPGGLCGSNLQPSVSPHHSSRITLRQSGQVDPMKSAVAVTFPRGED
jgi:hypothetical protein